MRKTLLYDLALSGKTGYRIQRHLLFFLAVFIYQLFRIGIFFPADKLWDKMWFIIYMSLVWGVFFNMFFTYVTAYYLLPKFFVQKKYLRFIIGMILLLCALQIAGILYNTTNISKEVSVFIGYNSAELKNYFVTNIRPGFIRLLGNPPLICGFFLALRTIKNWYKEQIQNELLAKENANAELQLLKAQVHPHFLFNTLNNIYSFTLNKSPEAGDLVEKLTDMLRYMITDCNTSLVPLEKELKMLEDYIGLEKVRYGDRLEMWTDTRGDYENKLIAPLIMIPFVENCFKHGSSMMTGRPWIKISTAINGNTLDFKIANSKPAEAIKVKNKKGIGLDNVKKRLELLYPGRHELNISSNKNEYEVRMVIQLNQKKRESTK
ncbi:MAG: histidine kinase [Bacteroidota bacterium]